MLFRNSIHFYTLENEDIKVSVVECFNRMLMSQMYCYFMFKNSRRYIDVLQQLLNSYNATHHRSIGMPPNEVNVNSKDLIHTQLYLSTKFLSKKFH